MALKETNKWTKDANSPWRGDTLLAHCANCGIGRLILFRSPSGATRLRICDWQFIEKSKVITDYSISHKV